MLFSLLANSCAPSAEDIYQEGKAHYKNKEYDKALDCYIKAKEQGYDSAYSAIASLYYYGLGVKKKYEKAFEYAQTANNKNAGGNYLLGKMYYYGNGVVKNQFKALEYFKKASDQGNLNAQYYLGRMYYFGHGVNKNYGAAFKLMKPLADKNDSDAQYFVGLMYFYGDGVVQNYSSAIHFFQEAANNNDLDGILMLGICYYDGCGVVKNTDLGKQYLKNAADQGNKYAAEILDNIITDERIGKTLNAIEKVAPFIPFFGIGWKYGKAGGEAVGAIVDAIGSFSD